MSIAVKVENLSKRYMISHRRQERYGLIRDAIADAARQLGSRIFRRHTALHGVPAETNREEFWALKDVSFEVSEGERIGIIGRNGAGKSTLLKILSRITEPTAGRVSIKGRVASLLEVGTGFHPELTGRENIYLNGSIMGMKRDEIRRRFDEIVAFSEVERFLDTPVKRYSSGMYVRLAFAVAAHLEPEILVVDEVLSVGDAPFQRKCLGKMELAGKEGRTIIFVSHNLQAVEVLCQRSMLMEGGRNSAIAPSKEVIARYLESVSATMGGSMRERKDRSGLGRVRVVNARFLNTRGGNQYAIGDDIVMQLEVENDYAKDVGVRLSLGIYNSNDAPLISCDSLLTRTTHTIPRSNLCTIECRIYAPPLNLGEYYVSFAIFNGNGEPEDWISPLSRFSVSAGDFDGRLASNPFPILSKFDWTVQPANGA